MRRITQWAILALIIIVLTTILFIGCDSATATMLPEDNNKGDIVNNTDNEVGEVDTETLEKGELGEEITKDDEKAEKDKKINNDKKESSEAENIKEIEPEKNLEEKNKKMYYSGDNNEKKLAITFDDGPSPKHTPEILKILKEYDIKATFFVLGQNASNNLDLLKTIKEEGHEIGNHSWSHKHLPKVSKTTLEDEIIKTRELLIDTFGEFDPVYRPPYGAVKSREKELLYSEGYNIVNWSVDTRDWEGISNEQMMGYVKQQLKPGGIILMHDGGGSSKPKKSTIEVLPEMIEWITEQGYEFVTVSELLKLN